MNHDIKQSLIKLCWLIVLGIVIGAILSWLISCDKPSKPQPDKYQLKVVQAQFAHSFAVQMQIDKIHEEINHAAHNGVFSIWLDYQISDEGYRYFQKLGYKVFVNKPQNCTAIEW